MEISITKAAKDWGISRVTLHKYIKEGVLSKQENGTLETSEMVRVFSEPKVKVNSDEGVSVYSNLQPEIANLQARIKVLEDSLQREKELARKSEEREAWLQGQVGNLTDSVKLLNAPKQPLRNSLLVRLLAVLCVVFGISLVVGHFGVAALK